MSSERFIQNRTALITLIAACLVVLISLGVRQTFGLFFPDFKTDLNISLTESGLAVGLQMLMWGYQDQYLEQLQISTVAIKP